jgi:uncharacterized protein with GYD domain
MALAQDTTTALRLASLETGREHRTAATVRSPAMPTYIVLGSFTEQGIRSVRDSLKREDAFRKQCEKVHAQVKEVYRTMGRYDLAAIVDAPDDVTMTSLVYSTSALGNIRTETLRAFTRQETEQALAKMM